MKIGSKFGLTAQEKEMPLSPPGILGLKGTPSRNEITCLTGEGA